MDVWLKKPIGNIIYFGFISGQRCYRKGFKENDGSGGEYVAEDDNIGNTF